MKPVKSVHALSVVLIVCIVSACETEKDTLEVVSKIQSLTQEEIAEKYEKGEYLPTDGPSAVLGVTWNGVDRKIVNEREELELVVENLAGVDLPVSVKLNVNGLFKKEVTIDYGEYLMHPRDKKVFTVSASEFPVQVTVGAGQLSADVRATIQKTSGTVEWIAPVATLYFTHKQDYSSMSVYGEAALIQFNQGHLYGERPGSEKTDEVIGRIKNNNGSFDYLRPDDCRVELKNNKGQVVGYLTAMDVSLGSDAKQEHDGMEVE